MPKYYSSSADDDGNDSSYESDNGTKYFPKNTTCYKLAEFNSEKPISNRNIQIQLTDDGLNYFLRNKHEVQTGYIAFQEFTSDIAELRNALNDLNWLKILAQYSTKIIDIILKKNHGRKGYLATGTYSQARIFEAPENGKTKVVLDPIERSNRKNKIKCDYRESQKKYRFFERLYVEPSFYMEERNKNTYRLVLPYMPGTLYGDLQPIRDYKEQIKLFLATVKALRTCHSKKIICLDLNPYNIKYRAPKGEDSIGESYLIDGGFSNQLGERIDTKFFRYKTQEQINKRMTDCYYIAPECWYIDSAAPLAHESMDIYSMGKILQKILTPLASELDPFIKACSKKDPHERATLDNLDNELELLLETTQKILILK